jgi:hypothetical protein
MILFVLIHDKGIIVTCPAFNTKPGIIDTFRGRSLATRHDPYVPVFFARTGWDYNILKMSFASLWSKPGKDIAVFLKYNT